MSDDSTRDALALVDLPPVAPTTPDHCPGCGAELRRALPGASNMAIGLCACPSTWGQIASLPPVRLRLPGRP